MDFKSLISKIESIDGRVITPKAPELPKTMQLNEDAELRVLAGTSTYIVEANKKAEETVDEGQDDLKKVGDKVKTTHGTMTKTASGVKHERSYGKDKDKDEDDEDAPKAKKAKKESIEPEFKSKFMKMVEAKKEAKKKEKKMAEAVTLKPGAKERAEKEKQDRAAEEKRRAESPGVSLKKKPMGEAAKPDFLDLDKDGNKKEPMKSAAKSKDGDKKDSGKKGMSAAQEKYFGKKNESVKTSKKVVAESVETVLTFKDMVKLVQESGGQQQIDPVDKALFTWAERVAKAKLGEGMKAELYAGLIYERNGGVFEMYDVLSESKKKINEGRVQLDEGMLDKVKSVLMSKLAPKLSDQEKSKMKAAAEKVLGKSEVSSSDFTLDNIKAISKALGAKPSTASESIEEGPMDVLGKMAGDAGKKVGDFFGQKKVDPKSGKGTIGSVDAWHPNATLGEKLASLTGILGGTAATIAGFFGGPAWLIIPGILALMFLSQVGGTKD